jgi:uncharacterized protein YaiI (UPF0178 family)
MSNYEQTVYVDACPVKDEIEELCRNYEKKVVFVASYADSLQLQKG